MPAPRRRRPRREAEDDPHFVTDDGAYDPSEDPATVDPEPTPRRAEAAPPRGRRRAARFELEFGDFEPATRSRSRGGRTRTGGESISLTFDDDDRVAAPAARSTRRRRGEPEPEPEERPRRRARSGADAGPDAVEGEIKALERFEDAVQTVRGKAAASGGGSDLGARILVAVPAAAVAIVLVAQGGPVFAVGVALFALVGMWELTQLFERTRPSLIAGGIGVAAVIAAAYLGGREAMTTALVATVPLVFLAVAVTGSRGGMPGVAVTMLGIVWLGFAVGHAVLLRESTHGGGVVVDVLVGTFLGDTGAYLGGRMFGSRKLAPRISPNKTVEGLLIGALTCIAAVWFAGLYQDWLSGTDALLIGLAVAVVAPLGDLFESFLKRDAGKKDAGTLFGAHGGVLDRLDAAMFALVAGYYVWLALGGA